jgi:hypothetical protein
MKNCLILYFLKIRLVGAELFMRTDRRTDRHDMTKLIIVFRNYANAPKIYISVFTQS